MGEGGRGRGVGASGWGREGGGGSAQVLVNASHVDLDLPAAVLHERGPTREEASERVPGRPVRAVDLPHVQHAAVLIHRGEVDEVAVVQHGAHGARVVGRLEGYLELDRRREGEQGPQTGHVVAKSAGVRKNGGPALLWQGKSSYFGA